MIRKKQSLLVILSLCLILCLAFSARAEGTLHAVYRAGTTLLLNTDNVTLTGHADFYLNERYFKTFDGKYVQDGCSSLMDITMTTPTLDNSVSQSGYTVVANGDAAYFIDKNSPEVYSPVPVRSSSAVLSNEKMTKMMESVIGTVVHTLDTPLSGFISSEKTASGAAHTLRIGEMQAPETLNDILTAAAMPVLKAYFHPYSRGGTPWVIVYNHQELIKTLYKDTYGAQMPDHFFNRLYDRKGQKTLTYYQYDQLRDQLNTLVDQIEAETDSGVVILMPDKSQRRFQSLNDYLISKEQLIFHFEDYSAALSAYLAQHDPQFQSQDPDSDMRAHYKNILTDSGCAGMIIEADGDYILCKEDSVLIRLSPYIQTDAERLASQTDRIALGETCVTVTLDAQGRITAAQGQALLHLTDFVGRTHLLRVEFDCAAQNYGQSVVKTFDPNDYGID